MKITPTTRLNSTDKLSHLINHFRNDLTAGFLVFLIALPLCLGIAAASGFPPMAGIISAILGGLVVSRISGSHLTITGPAAGLIVVIFSSVQNLGAGDMQAGYRFTLAAIVISGLLQVVLGHYKAGRLAAFFPASVVHGLLAAIGIIIMTKQIPVMLGLQLDTPATIWDSLRQLPYAPAFFIPKIGLIAILALCVLLGWPHIQQPLVSKLPAPLMVIVLGILLGYAFDLRHFQPEPIFNLPGNIHINGPFLVDIPDNLLSSITYPDFSKLTNPIFWQSVLSITLIGSLETLLSSTAVDKLDRQQRNADLNRDLRAIGIGNTLSGLLGGLPMIAEIVRSSANIEYGAQSSWANFFHGAFLLIFVLLFPHIIDSIPLASLAVLLVYTGFRLASPQTFAKTMDLGREQLSIFVVTLISILLTNLLIGVLLGILTKLAIHLLRGVSLKNLLRISYDITQSSSEIYHIKINGSAIFSNFIALKSQLADLPVGKTIIFDLSQAYLIDHTVMDFIHAYRQVYIQQGGHCDIQGLSQHASVAEHKLAARIKKP